MEHHLYKEPLTELRRAFLALRGVTHPRVGDKGRYIDTGVNLAAPDPDATRLVAVVTVTAMSKTGRTLTVTFDEAWAQRAYGATAIPFRRVSDDPSGMGWYWPNVSVLGGELRFDDGRPMLPWRMR